MNKKRIVSLLLALAMIFALAGCTSSEPAQPAEPSEPEASGSAITVTDMTGREITLDEPATRVVALSAADCEFLYAVGAGDTLVGRGEYCDYPAEVLDVPSVQSGYDTNIEQITGGRRHQGRRF